MLSVQDRSLPPDHEAWLSSAPQTGRVLVIAPTRAACETIEIALTLRIDTFLERTQGEHVRELARSGKGFGIIAGTGTGKTLAVRPIAEEILRAPLRVGVVNREREATPELPNLNVVIITTGIARRWFQDGDISQRDTLIVDEIHQTSAELELCLALGKRVGCRFVWLSATVDAEFFKRYLNSSEVLEVRAFDKSKAARVEVVEADALQFLAGRFVNEVVREKRGVGVFLPTRAGVEAAANLLRENYPRLNTAFYHGGETVRTVRPFLEDDGAPKPYLLAMTAAGQSALNVRGLDTVVIEDARYANTVEQGRNVLARVPLGNNEILQMAGRVHGRIANGRVFLLSKRDIDFYTLRPTPPEFQLAGDSERVALSCAALGVRADDLELPVALDKLAYRRAYDELSSRGIINVRGRLTTYGKAVEALPVERAWAELLVNADRSLLPFLAVMSCLESLHRITREEARVNDLLVPDSDHLSAYNLYADAFAKAGSVGESYGLPRHVFDAIALERWATRRGVLEKSIEEASVGMASVFRALNQPLPTQMPRADASVLRAFRDLLARFMPFDLVIDERTKDGQEARVSKSSVCANDGAIAGDVRFFADRHGAARASVEGTRLPLDVLLRYAKRAEPRVIYDAKRAGTPLVLSRDMEYFGFVLSRERQVLRDWPDDVVPQARRALAEALARQEAEHPAVAANRPIVDEVRALFKRSGGTTPRLGFHELSAHYEEGLNAAEVNAWSEFRRARLPLRADDFVSPKQRAQLWALPANVEVRDRRVEIDYDVEEHDGATVGVAQLRLPEKLARTLNEDELPRLDRPLRFLVSRGSLGAVRAGSLQELQAQLEGPWTPNDELRERPPLLSPGISPRQPRSSQGKTSRNANGKGKPGKRAWRGPK